MVIIRFPNPDAKRKALGYLAGRFTFKSWASGDMVVDEVALPYLAVEGISFEVEGPASYERLISSVRIPAAAKV